MSEADLQEFLIGFIQGQRLYVDYAYVAAFALLVYDHLQTLYLEIVHVWYSRWTYTKILFLLTRYVPLFNMVFSMYNQLVPDADLHICSWSLRMTGWLSLIGITFAQVILMVRTWVVWSRHMGIGYLLIFLTLGMFISGVVWTVSFQEVFISAAAPFPGYKGCFYQITNAPLVSSQSVSFYSLPAVDGVILVLMSISAFQAYRLRDTTKLSNILHRDGILFCLYLLCVTLSNGTILSFGPISISNMLVLFPMSLYSVLTARVIINVRVAASAHSRETIELHSAYRNFEYDANSATLEFRMPLSDEREREIVPLAMLGKDIEDPVV